MMEKKADEEDKRMEEKQGIEEIKERRGGENGGRKRGGCHGDQEGKIEQQQKK